MHRRPAVAAIVLSLGALAGCASTPDYGGPVTVPLFTPAAGAAEACPGLIADLPATLGENTQRETTGSAYGAAWGNPAIVLRCGVPEPKDFDPYAACQTVNGVDWFVESNTDEAATRGSVKVTTVYRKPAVQITIPARYAQGPAIVMSGLTTSVKAHSLASQHCK